MATIKKMSFVPMSSIAKKSTEKETDCTDWVATEKVHGASFQFYTSDGKDIHMGSRTRCLDGQVSFQKCNLAEYLARYSGCVTAVHEAVTTDPRWHHYRMASPRADVGDDDSDTEDMASRRERDLEALNSEENGGGDMGGSSSHVNVSEHREDKKDSTEGKVEEGSETESSVKEQPVELRIYGELYGGGGVLKDLKPAVQKEILYCDEFRFYVFGVTINRKWVTIAEMNDLCKDASFPHYAKPVCEPKATLEELKEFLVSSGFMSSKSSLTDREDAHKTNIEGVVMAPLKRNGYGKHSIKLLSAAFNDVRIEQQACSGKTLTVNYCTKARYMSVISKLDIPEREDTDLVTRMFIEDIEKESGEPLSVNKSKGCVKAVRQWLTKDGYIHHTSDGKRAAAVAAPDPSDKLHRAQNDSATRGDDQDGDSEAESGFGGLFG